MHKRHSPPILAERYPLAFFAALIDVLLIISASYLSHYWRFGTWEMSDHYRVATLTLALTSSFCLTMMGTYTSWRGRPLVRQLGRVFVGWLLALAIVLGTSFLLKTSGHYSRIWLGTAVLLYLAGLFGFRVMAYLLLRFVRSRGKNLKRVVLVEGDTPSDEINRRLPILAQQGYQIAERRTAPLLPNCDAMQSLVQAVIQSGAHEVWICLPLSAGDTIKAITHGLRHLTVEVRFLPDLADITLLNHRVNNIAGMVTLDISCSPMDGPVRILKRMEDIVVGGLISLMILPLCLLIAIAVKCTSSGPVIFKQYRTGINGRTFKVYKFRSMEVHTESGGAVTQASYGDPRVTRLGAFLRRTSLDELPQFFNVLQGRMSVVGPRPHALAHNEYYKDLVESYMKRHKVKPGITGWAQVNGYRGETDTLEKMQKRVEYDLWYINNWSLWLDIKIVFLTVFKGFINNKP